MCKRDMSYLEDEIREEYSEFSCLEIFNEIDRLRKEEKNVENKLRLSILAEMAKDCEMDEDKMFE